MTTLTFPASNYDYYFVQKNYHLIEELTTMYSRESGKENALPLIASFTTNEAFLPETFHLPPLEHQRTEDYPHNARVSQLVAQQANATPDALALSVAGQTMSYKELNQQANRLAHYLRTLGVCPNMPVGICVERSLNMVVGMLGILKAGGAYVPMDPSYPRERLTFIVEDAHIPILLTHEHLAGRFTAATPYVFCLDRDSSILEQQGTDELSALGTIDDLMYVIYTSGSTGRPKGTQITHASFLNLVRWHLGAFNVTASDRATQVASPAFDATGWELWPYLTIGASVHLPDEQVRITPTLLRDWLIEKGITISFLPTPLAENVIALRWPLTTDLRFLLTGGDTLHHYPSPDLPFALINNYGLTETTVVSTSGRVPPLANAGIPLSIGRPIANTEIYLLDEHLQPVPVGQPGELYIGGAGLAKGYLNRSELTAERFLSHPFSQEPGARLYKTGDLACYRPDGQIIFMGRSDQQVKIRGYRIELGEIESVLNQHPAVRQAVVAARENTSGEKSLVAYVVLERRTEQSEALPAENGHQDSGACAWVPQSMLSLTDLRGFLQVQLPDYMLPTLFVQIEALPITPNGKVDRAALPAPDETSILRDNSSAVFNTPVEERLATIMGGFLGLQQIGRDDDFFILGGHSLLGTQIIMRVAEIFGVRLSLRTIFEAPTVALLSAEIENLIIAQIESMSDDDAQLLLAEAQHGYAAEEGLA